MFIRRFMNLMLAVFLRFYGLVTEKINVKELNKTKKQLKSTLDTMRKRIEDSLIPPYAYKITFPLERSCGLKGCDKMATSVVMMLTPIDQESTMSYVSMELCDEHARFIDKSLESLTKLYRKVRHKYQKERSKENDAMFT